jgi:hypothetical protein
VTRWSENVCVWRCKEFLRNNKARSHTHTHTLYESNLSLSVYFVGYNRAAFYKVQTRIIHSNWEEMIDTKAESGGRRKRKRQQKKRHNG